MKDIARNAKIGYTTLKLFWNDLALRGVVKQTRKVGKARMYKLNLKNPEVKAFTKFYWSVIKNCTKESLHL